MKPSIFRDLPRNPSIQFCRYSLFKTNLHVTSWRIRLCSFYDGLKSQRIEYKSIQEVGGRLQSQPIVPQQKNMALEFQFQIGRLHFFSTSSSEEDDSSPKPSKKPKGSSTKRNLILSLSTCGFLCLSNLIWSAHTTTSKILQRTLVSSYQDEYFYHPTTIIHATTSATTIDHKDLNNSSSHVDIINSSSTRNHHNNSEKILNDHNQNTSLDSLSGSSNSSYPFTFGACLMTKDDNQILPEWLAYTTLYCL